MIEWFGFIWAIGIAIAAATIFLHVVFTAAVYLDARRLVDRDKVKPAMAPGEVWALATLVGGVLSRSLTG